MANIVYLVYQLLLYPSVYPFNSLHVYYRYIEDVNEDNEKKFSDKYTIFNLFNFQPQHILNMVDSEYFVKSASTGAFCAPV